jgi:hypothetical protein
MARMAQPDVGRKQARKCPRNLDFGRERGTPQRNYSGMYAFASNMKAHNRVDGEPGAERWNRMKPEKADNRWLGH